MSYPQHRILDYVEKAHAAAAGSADLYSEAVNIAGAGAIVGIRTGDWRGFSEAFTLLQKTAQNALERRRHARMTDHLFGGDR